MTVDDTEVIKQLPYNEVAWHAGKGNTRSVAIEQCMHKGIDVASADERLCQLIALLCKELSIPIERVVTHKHWTGKNCPSVLLSKWPSIISRVEEILGGSMFVLADRFIVPSDRNFQPLERLHPSWLEEMETEEIDEHALAATIGSPE